MSIRPDTAGSAAASFVVRRLSAGYGARRILRELDLPEFRAGETIALVGPNGAGKSTLLRAIAGLIPSTGSALLGGYELVGAAPRARAGHVAFMPQTLPERVALTVLEGVLAALRATPVADAPFSSRETQRTALRALERVGIADLAMEPLDRLSGGQRQLASLAQTIVRGPRLLLLDEPTSALDLRHQVTVMQLVRDLATEGRVVLMVVHDLNLAARWADRIVVMDRGVVHAAGRPEEAISPAVIGRVYGVSARVERCSHDQLQVMVDGLTPVQDHTPVPS